MATILLATGDTGLYDVFAAELGGEGHDVIWATDGREAYDLALEQSPDLVFLDVSLPIFNALETCTMLRGDPDVPTTLPVVLLSDEDLDPHKIEKARATRLFPRTHLVQALRDLLAAHLGPEALP